MENNVSNTYTTLELANMILDEKEKKIVPENIRKRSADI